MKRNFSNDIILHWNAQKVYPFDSDPSFLCWHGPRLDIISADVNLALKDSLFRPRVSDL